VLVLKNTKNGSWLVRLVQLALTLVTIMGGGQTTSAFASTEEHAAQAAVLINNIRSKLDTCDANGMLGASASSSGSSPNQNTATLTQVSGGASKRSDPSRRPALIWNPQLAQAALSHSKAMAKELFFDHNDMQGRAVNHRVVDQGYRFRVVGENIAAGQASLEEAIRDWLLSAGHCVNMIDERFTEFGIAKVASTRQDDPYGVYWTLVLGQPRDGQVARR
jgi:uncharacterized protein YkwD